LSPRIGPREQAQAPGIASDSANPQAKRQDSPGPYQKKSCFIRIIADRTIFQIDDCIANVQTSARSVRWRSIGLRI
jgi:hypothetical protein